MAFKRLCEDVLLDIEYADTTPFGSMVSGRFEQQLRHQVAPVLAPIIERAWQAVDHADLQRRLRAADVLGQYFLDEVTLHEACLYPPVSQVRPAMLRAENPQGRVVKYALNAQNTQYLAAWIGRWHRGVEACVEDEAQGATLFSQLDQAGMLTDAPLPSRLPPSDLLFFGHACMQVGTPGTKLLTDPFIVPAIATDAAEQHAGYTPLSLHQTAIDGVLITHSHPDHFQLGTLLRLGHSLPICVPQVARESLLSIDMALRLRELGFTDVRVLGWHEHTQIGDVLIEAWPFYGEQPTANTLLHPEVRNVGNLYTVSAAGRRYGFIADGGADAAGDTRVVARAAQASHGALDVLFSGYRSWALYPAQLLGSSVGRYALFVPPAEWTRRQVLMNGPDEAIDVAEAWGARWLVPYADGGAPWFWQRGLGPDLSQHKAHQHMHFDPPPEVMLEAAAGRSSWGEIAVASPVKIKILRPGEGVIWQNHDFQEVLQTVSYTGHRWPWSAATTARQVNASSVLSTDAMANEELAIARKKVLLRILSRGHTLEPSVEVNQSLADHVRRIAGLTRRDQMQAWLTRCNLSLAQFTELISEWARCNALEQHFAEEIEQLLPGQLALQSMRFSAEAVL